MARALSAGTHYAALGYAEGDEEGRFCAAAHRNAAARVPILVHMGRHCAQYYAEFVLREGGSRDADEYSGIVELCRPAGADVEPEDIEALLAHNFELDADCVQLLRWARVH